MSLRKPSQILTRREAQRRGLTKYFTGEPCSRGHSDYRNAASGECYTCHRQAVSARYAERTAAARAERQAKAIERARLLTAVRAGWVSQEPKACSRCKAVLPAAEFNRDRYQPTGLNVSCRVCVALDFARWSKTPSYTERLTRAKANRHERRLVDPRLLWAQRAKSAAVARGKKRGFEVDITVDWLRQNAPVKCPLLGVALVYDARRSGNDSPALDRKDNTKGYTTDNCWVISMQANRIKTDATPEQVLRVGQALVRLLAS